MVNPVTVEMLRDDWTDHPDLSDKPDLRRKLEALSDDELRAALDQAFRGYEDMWLHVLDNTRSEATGALLRKHAPLG